MAPTVVSHSPSACRNALAGASSPVVIDLETSGKERRDQIVSAGLLVQDQIFILFIRSNHASIRNLTLDQFRWALEPLADPRRTTIYHNSTFDVGHLHRAGIKVGGVVHDTLQLLRLLDQDRGGDGATVTVRRRDLRAPAGAPKFTDYRLKNATPMLTGIGMIDFPGPMISLPYQKHVTYLASDLIGTKALYDHLMPRLGLRPELKQYHDRLCAPLTPLLVGMTETGVLADVDFIRAECGRLDHLANTLAARHQAIYGVSIDETAAQARWLWGALKLKPLPGKVKHQGARWVPSLDADHLDDLRARHAHTPRIADSLALIASYRRANSLRSKLRGLLRRVEHDGRIHTSLVDRQATGRISSSKPNLQQVARKKSIAEQDFICRNALIATPGSMLVAMDLAQADVRVLAHAVASHQLSAKRHLRILREQRYDALCALDPKFRELYGELEFHRNPQYRRPKCKQPPPEFDPTLGSGLARAFQDSTADFYTVTATQMLGAPPKDKRERDFCKQTILGVINGMGPQGLAKRLKCDIPTARSCLDKFEKTYPNDMAYRRMIVSQIALTGRVATFMARDRTDTAHRWLVALPRVRIMVSFKGPRYNRYWLDVTPLKPNRHTLTCYIHRAWDATPGRYQGTLIYDANRGCLTRRDYHLYDTTFLEYRLPVRNFGWRSIRRVRALGEEAKYRGLDAVTRALFNAVCQGGTADLTKLMMIGISPTLEWFGARLLLQIHDELVFEVPEPQANEFISTAVPELEGVVPKFAVPVILEPKYGTQFGDMRDMKSG